MITVVVNYDAPATDTIFSLDFYRNYITSKLQEKLNLCLTIR